MRLVSGRGQKRGGGYDIDAGSRRDTPGAPLTTVLVPAEHQTDWSRASGILRGAIHANRISPILANLAPVELGPRVVVLAGAG